MDFQPEVQTKSITVQGFTLSVPVPYAEGHTLTEAEAAVLNQTLAENLRNNFGSQIKKSREDLEAEGKAVLCSRAEHHVVQRSSMAPRERLHRISRGNIHSHDKIALHQGNANENSSKTDQDAPHQKDGFTETAGSSNDARTTPAKTDALGRPRSAAS